MSKVTVFFINGKYFISAGPAVREIPFSLVNDWRNQGVEIEIQESEQYV